MDQARLESVRQLIIRTESMTLHDCVHQIISCTTGITDFTLLHGNLTVQTTVRLADPNITSISLVNITLANNVKELLVNLFFRRNLKKLEILATDCSLYDSAFLDATNEFMGLITPEIGIEDFTFTLDQCCDQPIDNLVFLLALKRIKIFYSAQFQTKRIIAIAQTLRCFNALDITFEEYYDANAYKGTVTNQYIGDLRAGSLACQKILEAYEYRVFPYKHEMY